MRTKSEARRLNVGIVWCRREILVEEVRIRRQREEERGL